MIGAIVLTMDNDNTIKNEGQASTEDNKFFSKNLN